jgi:hypothetical protein
VFAVFGCTNGFGSLLSNRVLDLVQERLRFNQGSLKGLDMHLVPIYFFSSTNGAYSTRAPPNTRRVSSEAYRNQARMVRKIIAGNSLSGCQRSSTHRLPLPKFPAYLVRPAQPMVLSLPAIAERFYLDFLDCPETKSLPRFMAA